MSNKEEVLIHVATYGNDNNANLAMKKLRENFDNTYFWCMECDGLVVKELECCKNRPTVVAEVNQELPPF